MAHMDGSGPGSDTNVVPLALARLEQMIQVRLAESLDVGEDPAITVKIYDSNDREPSSAPAICDEPAFYDAVVNKIVSTIDDYLDEVEHGAELSATALNEEIENAFVDISPRACDVFIGRLRCMSCGIVTRDESAACETFLRTDSEGGTYSVGDEFHFDASRVARDYYAHTTRPNPDEAIHVVEGWACPHCSNVNWAEVTLRDDRVASIWSIELTRDALDRAHFVTSECVELASRVTGRPAWSLLGDDVFDILYDSLESH